MLTDLNLDAIQKTHKAKQSLITLAVTNRHSDRVFLLDADNRLRGWQHNKTGEQKLPSPASPLHPMAYSCVAVFQSAVFDQIPQRGKFSLTETYLSLAADHLIYGYDHSGDRFVDVGKPESVAIAESLFP